MLEWSPRISSLRPGMVLIVNILPHQGRLAWITHVHFFTLGTSCLASLRDTSQGAWRIGAPVSIFTSVRSCPPWLSISLTHQSFRKEFSEHVHQSYSYATDIRPSPSDMIVHKVQQSLTRKLIRAQRFATCIPNRTSVKVCKDIIGKAEVI